MAHAQKTTFICFLCFEEKAQWKVWNCDAADSTSMKRVSHDGQESCREPLWYVSGQASRTEHHAEPNHESGKNLFEMDLS